MKRQPQPSPRDLTIWRWPIDLQKYDLTESLTEEERAELKHLFKDSVTQIRRKSKDRLHRLLLPLIDIFMTVSSSEKVYYETIRIMLMEMHRYQRPFWTWSLSEWKAIVGKNGRQFASRYGWIDSEHSSHGFICLVSKPRHGWWISRSFGE